MDDLMTLKRMREYCNRKELCEQGCVLENMCSDEEGYWWGVLTDGELIAIAEALEDIEVEEP